MMSERDRLGTQPVVERSFVLSPTSHGTSTARRTSRRERLHRHAIAGADVVHLAGDAARRERKIRLDCVGHVQEVARGVEIAERSIGAPAFRRRRATGRARTSGSRKRLDLPRPRLVERARADHAHAVGAERGERHRLLGALARRRTSVLGRHSAVSPSARGRVVAPVLLGASDDQHHRVERALVASAAHCRQQRHARAHIGGKPGHRIVSRRRNEREPRQMEDRVRAPPRRRRFAGDRRIRAGPARSSGPRRVRRHSASGPRHRQGNAGDLPAIAQQRAAEPLSDEAGRPGDERPCQLSPRPDAARGRRRPSSGRAP